MTAARTLADLRAYRQALDAAEAQCRLAVAAAERARAEALRTRDAMVLLAEARYLRARDSQCSHDLLEDAPFGIIGCSCEMAGCAR
jgi:hypothetical protein